MSNLLNAVIDTLHSLASGRTLEVAIGGQTFAITIAMHESSTLHQRAKLPIDHSPDFSSVVWFGVDYTFNRTQAAIVGVLWRAWARGMPDVHGRTLLREVDSCAEDVRDVFRGHPAWDRMLKRSSKCGGPIGCFRLAETVTA